ncbi:MAG: hypothetical protein HOO96_00640 [Polyangiaceae bacterium]|nr:hypothetical protein [Polyangiaceae bacterium]
MIGRPLGAVVMLMALASASTAVAQAPAPANAAPVVQATVPPSTDDDLFRLGNDALQAGRPAEAIGDFEALADREHVDPAISFNRGLAYAGRVAIDRAEPGDVGQAIAGFEEARALTRDDALRDSADASIVALRTVVAKRAARSGGSVVTPATPVSLAIAQSLGKSGWAYVALGASALLTLALFFRLRRGTGSRFETAGNLGIVLTVPLLAAGLAFAYVERTDRRSGYDAVVIRERIEVRDAAGKVDVVYEGAKVRVTSDVGDRVHVRYGELEGNVDRTSLRRLASLD